MRELELEDNLKVTENKMTFGDQMLIFGETNSIGSINEYFHVPETTKRFTKENMLKVWCNLKKSLKKDSIYYPC